MNPQQTKQYKPYSAYQSSGIEWLGEVPEEWEIKRLRFTSERNPSKSRINHLSPDTIVSFLAMESIGEEGELKLEENRELQSVQSGYTYFENGDIIIAKITPCFENGKGALCEGLTNNIGFGTTELMVLRPGRSINPRLLFYISKTHAFRKIGEALMQGAAGQKRISDEFIANFPIPLGTKSEQKAIAYFLDTEMARLDALVVKKQRLIELLKEKRQATISQAVTKGLDLSVPMKDSGIEWLGEVPAHWQVQRVKNVAKLESGHTPSKQVPEYWENCNIQWVSLNDSKQLAANDFISDTAVKINHLGLANSSARILPAGAVVFTRDATIGLAAITTSPMAVSQHLIAWCPSEKINNKYLLRVFNAMKLFLDSYTFGATIKTIGMPDVKKLVTPVPPIQEQLEIIDYLDQALANMDYLINKIQENIILLQERRAALISATVTGKIDVREYVQNQDSQPLAMAGGG